MNKQTFYKTDTKDKVRVWTIEVFHGSPALSDIITTTSILDTPTSVIQTVTPITEGKNIGKANETSVAQQADFDAQTEINKKIKNGYVSDLVNIKVKHSTSTIQPPMKGFSYHPNPDKNNKKDKRMTLDQLGIKDVLINCSFKQDGWRGRFKVTKDEVVTYTSSGDITLDFPQISESLLKSFNKIYDYVNTKYGVTEYILDGEIYAHELQLIKDSKGNIIDLYYEKNKDGFNATASACASVKNITPIKQKLRDQMKFVLFDVCLDAPFTTRRKVLEYFYSDTVIPVENTDIIATDESINELFENALSEGYEGLMLRKLDKPYEYRRTKQLTKFKPKDDNEYEVIGFKKSITGNTLGSLECITSDGTKFFANLKDDIGDDVTKQLIWNNQANYLEKWVTIEYMGITPDGSLRHPRAKAFRKGKSQD